MWTTSEVMSPIPSPRNADTVFRFELATNLKVTEVTEAMQAVIGANTPPPVVIEMACDGEKSVELISQY
jgi:hypothetical protein